MENTAPKYKAVLASLAVCMLCAGFILVGAACPQPPQPTPPCTADADCATGQVCNTATGTCEAAPTPGCTSDDDCADGQFCDTQTGDCETNVNLYAEVPLDHDFHSTAAACTTCHHDGAGFDTCDTCHNRDEVVGGIAVLQDVMHDADGGCRSCHDDEQNEDGTWDCSYCHTALGD